MATQSPQTPPPASPATRPLWIIAVSLAAIAICLVLITIRMQLDGREAAMVARDVEIVAGEHLPRKPDQPQRERRTYVRPQPVPELAEVTPALPIEIPVTNVEVVVAETIVPSRGFEADVSVVRSTNSSPGIVGRVVLRGVPPMEVVPEGSNRPPCLDLPGKPSMNPVFKVGNDGALADVIVAISDGMGGKKFPPAMTNQLLTFSNCQIYPLVSGIRTGQVIVFKSADGQAHGVKFLGGQSSNTTMRAGNSIGVGPGRERSVVWSPKDPNLVEIKCVRHPWETASFAAYDHPFFAVTDTNGNFAIPRLAAGSYTLRAIHRGLAATNEIQTVTLRRGETSVVNFTIDSPSWKATAPELSAHTLGHGNDRLRQ